MEELIKRYITMPMAITVFKQDLEKFNEFKLGNLYLDMIESIIDRMTKDYLELQRKMYTKHHIDIKKIEKGKYQVNGEIMEFTSDELKDMTNQLMSEYLYGDKAGDFERKDRMWSPNQEG